MNKNRRYALLFLMLGVAFISGGMGLKNVFEYSPTIGWLAGFISFISGSFFASKMKKESTY